MTPPNLQEEQEAHLNVILEQTHGLSNGIAACQGLSGYSEIMTEKKLFDGTLNSIERDESPGLFYERYYSFAPTCVCRFPIMLCTVKAYRDGPGSSHRSRLSLARLKLKLTISGISTVRRRQ